MAERWQNQRTRLAGALALVLGLTATLVVAAAPAVDAETPGIEPGCSKLAWIGEDDEFGLDEQVFAAQADGRDRVRITAPTEETYLVNRVWEAAWLGDGRIAVDDGYIIDADGGNPTPYPGADSPIPAPVGNRFAAPWYESGVWVVASDGTTNFTSDEGTNWPLTWSPTAGHLVWFGADGVMLADADLATKTVILPQSQVIHSGSSAADRTYAWSPTGAQIAVHDGSNIIVKNVDGSIVATVPGSAPPVWSPDGSHIAWRNGGSVRLADSSAATVTTLGAGSQPTFSPDGSRIAWIDSGGTVMLADSDGTNQVEIAASASVLSWPENGSRLAFRDGLTFGTVGSDGSDPVVLDADARLGPAGLDAAWSPDGTRIQWLSGSGRQWWLADADGSNRISPEIGGWGDWSPDSKLLASRVTGNHIVVTDADGIAQEYVTDGYPKARYGFYEIGWSPCVFDPPGPSPANDDFEAAAPLTDIATAVLAGNSVVVEGTTVGAHTQLGEPSQNGGEYWYYPEGPYRSVWWTWTPAVDVLVQIDASDSEIDAAVAVWTGTAVDDLTLIVRDGDREGSAPVRLAAQAGVTYYIGADATAELEQGAVTLNFEPPQVDLDSCTILGTDGPDELEGTPGPDVICGLGGNDEILGFGGMDVIFGGPGDDIIKSGGGRDFVIGGAGSDRLIGGSGNDAIDGGDGGDRLYGGKGDDIIFAGRANDRLFGFTGNDRLYGQDGADLIFGGDDNDLLDGGALDDTCNPGAGDDTVIRC